MKRLMFDGGQSVKPATAPFSKESRHSENCSRIPGRGPRSEGALEHRDSLGKASRANRWLGIARFALAIAICVVAVAVPGFAQLFQPNAIWTNQHGSTLTIRAIAPDGSFTGSFVNRSRGPCDNERYPVTGWIDGEKVSFTVRWVNAKSNCEAITSWTGYLDHRGVLARWIFVHFNRDGVPILSSGTDIFH
jgi:hypothetical protein